MYTAGLVLALSALGMAADPLGWELRLEESCLVAHNWITAHGTHSHSVRLIPDELWPATGIIQLEAHRGSLAWGIALPLWMPAICAVAALGTARLVGWSSRPSPGRCPASSYELSGITGPCPECGKERQ